jgi:hypothetical protein
MMRCNESKGGSQNFKGAECSANSSHIFILPDGKVTIGEQLYWKPHFIIGDLSRQTIKFRSKNKLCDFRPAYGFIFPDFNTDFHV